MLKLTPGGVTKLLPLTHNPEVGVDVGAIKEVAAGPQAAKVVGGCGPGCCNTQDLVNGEGQGAPPPEAGVVTVNVSKPGAEQVPHVPAQFTGAGGGAHGFGPTHIFGL